MGLYIRCHDLCRYDSRHVATFSSSSIQKSTSRIASQALHVAHRNQVIHRDIKPGNILLDEDKNAYLADFGIAKDHTANQNITEPEAFIGSPEYLAPEQARSEPVTPHTDIYSLGVVLYEMLEGKHPFPGIQKMQVMFKHLNDPLPDIMTPDDAIINEINAVIQKATAKKPDHRYGDVMEMLQALTEAAKLNAPSTPRSVVEMLTPREQEVLQLIMDGKSNRQIADTLVVAETTIKSYITSIYRKLKVRSRVQAIARARDLDFLIRKPTNRRSVTTGELPEPENPYKGLRAFQAADAQNYFGREKLTKKLITRLQATNEHYRFLALVGPSGSGKSSLAKAGLIPALWRGELHQSENWYIVDLLPGSHPIEELEVTLFQVASDKSINLHQQLMRDKRGLLRVADMILPDDGSELLIVIDQFEEVFTLLEDETQRQHFLSLILEATTDKRSRVRVVITLRADYYDRPLQYPEFGELMRNRVETVLPLSAEELERAISEPAYRVNVSFEDGLVSRIVSDVHYQPGALPLLQYALTELFERRDGLSLTFEAYEAIGGTGGALAKRADDIYLEGNEQGRELVRQLFLRLVTLGEGAEDTRRRADRAELINIASDPELMEEIIDIYAASRLLSLDHDPATRRPTIEVAHEAILREWDRLRQWLNESRDDIRQQRFAAQAAKDWHFNKRDKSYLLRGSRLDQVETWYGKTALSLTSFETEFIAASIKQREIEIRDESERQTREKAQEKRSRNLLRALVAVFALAALLSVGFGIFALNQQLETASALDVAKRSGLAFAANSSVQIGEIDLALALAMESVGDNDDEILAETRGIFETLADSAGPVRLLNNVPWCGRMTSGPALHDRIWLIRECGNDMMFTYDSVTHERIATAPFTSIAQEATSFAGFSPDNQFFAMAISPWYEESIEIGIWRTSDMSQVSTLVIDRPIIALRWSWDSSMVASIDMLPENLSQAIEEGIEIGNGISFWDIQSGELVRHLDIDAPYYHSLNFSHDGAMGVVGGWSSFDEDKQYQVTVFDTSTGETLYQFERLSVFHPTNDSFGAGEVGFSPDATIVWFAGYPGYAITLATGETYGHMHEFVPETSRVANGDSYIPYAASDHETLLTKRATPDANFEYLTSLGANDYRLLNIHTGEIITYANFAFMMPTQAANQFMVSFYGRSQTFYLWDLYGRDNLVAIIPAGGNFPIGSYSPDGRYLAVTGGTYGQSSGSVTKVYYADTLELAYEIDNEFNLPYDLTWSPDSRYLATTMTTNVVEISEEVKLDYQSVVLWDADTGVEVRRFSYSEEDIPMTQVEFTPDGRYILVGRSSRLIRTEGVPYILMFEVETGELVKRIDMPVFSDPNYGTQLLRMHPTRNLLYVTINSDVLSSGNILGISGDRYAAYLVDLDTDEIQRIPNNFLPYGAEFTSDGRQIVFSAFDGNRVRIYDIEKQEFVQEWQSDQAGISALDISDDGNWVITPSSMLASDPIINLWDFETGTLIRRFAGHNPQVFLLRAEFAPDGERFLSTAVDSTVLVWRVDRQLAVDWVRDNRFIRSFTCVEREIYRLQPLCDE